MANNGEYDAMLADVMAESLAHAMEMKDIEEDGKRLKAENEELRRREAEAEWAVDDEALSAGIHESIEHKKCEERERARVRAVQATRGARVPPPPPPRSAPAPTPTPTPLPTPRPTPTPAPPRKYADVKEAMLGIVARKAQIQAQAACAEADRKLAIKLHRKLNGTEPALIVRSPPGSIVPRDINLTPKPWTDGKLPLPCPWCAGGIEVNGLECGVMRHGLVLTTDGKEEQMPQHAWTKDIDYGVIRGCGYQLAIGVLEDGDYIAMPVDGW